MKTSQTPLSCKEKGEILMLCLLPSRSKPEETSASSTVGLPIRQMKKYSLCGQISITKEKIDEQETWVALLILL